MDSIRQQLALKWLCRAAVALLFVAMLPVAGSDAEDLDWRIEKVEASTAWTENGKVRVDSRLGDVRVRGGDEGLVEASAVVQREGSDGFEAVLVLREDSGDLFVELEFLSPDGAPVEQLPDDPRRRADLTLLVPPSVELDLITQGDLIEAKGVSGQVVATSETGDISVVTSGGIRAATQRGAITLRLEPGELQPECELETLTGDIEFWVGPDQGAKITGETFGEITTDFSVEIVRRENSLKKYLHSVLGDGGRRVTLVSNRGKLRLFQFGQ